MNGRPVAAALSPAYAELFALLKYDPRHSTERSDTEIVEAALPLFAAQYERDLEQYLRRPSPLANEVRIANVRSHLERVAACRAALERLLRRS